MYSLLLLTLLPTQCAGGACSLPVAGYEWRLAHNDPARQYLYRSGVQVGGWDAEHHIFRRFDPVTRTWSDPEPPPWDTDKKPAPLTNFGVDLDKLGTRPANHLNGRPVSRAEALAALQGGPLPDDATKLRLTVIGSDADRQRVLADLAHAEPLTNLARQLLVQDYPPDHWAVSRAGFVTNGKPTIYLQSADGTVLHRQDDYDGPAPLAEALRKADPNYRPNKDLDLRQMFAPLAGLAKIPAPIWLLGALVLFLLLRR